MINDKVEPLFGLKASSCLNVRSLQAGDGFRGPDAGGLND
jgi:hypothetical protein